VLVESDAPIVDKKETANTQNRKLFERAWFAIACEKYEGRPYVSRSALLDFLISSNGFKPSHAEAMIKPDGKMIGELLNSDLISPVKNGWIVVDNLWISALELVSDL
jgi:hypothetical protein